MPHANPSDPRVVSGVLSVPRSETYLRATNQDLDRAMALYGWNARVAAALLVPAHLAEVSTRNAVDVTLNDAYGERWPWEPSFEQSLPDPAGRVFNPRRELRKVREQHHTTGKVVAELKFAFWQAMFTRRHDRRIWNTRILREFPNAASSVPREVRGRIYADLEVVRKLRNRIAHHEPIFTRDLGQELTMMFELTEMRCSITGNWARALEDVTVTLAQRP